ncbi:MAG: hypothetical protein ISR00_03190 [Flavobacteriales bacterium]|nr:hypothetical protein [Flavobacteriales bacterium]MBL6872938.1 hypothetical protein [Flavobacteriales bacterium]
MKKLINTLSIITCIVISANAQNFTEAISTEFNFNSGSLPVIQTQFDKVSKSNVEKALKTIFKAYNAKLTPIKGSDNEFLVSEFSLESNQK